MSIIHHFSILTEILKGRGDTCVQLADCNTFDTVSSHVTAYMIIN